MTSEDLHRHERSIAAVNPFDFAGDQPVGYVIDSRATVFGRNCRSQQAESAHFRRDLPIETLIPDSQGEPVAGAGPDNRHGPCLDTCVPRHRVHSPQGTDRSIQVPAILTERSSMILPILLRIIHCLASVSLHWPCSLDRARPPRGHQTKITIRISTQRALKTRPQPAAVRGREMRPCEPSRKSARISASSFTNDHSGQIPIGHISPAPGGLLT